MKNFDKLLEGWMLDEENGESAEKFPWKVTEEQKLFLKDKVSGTSLSEKIHSSEVQK